MNVRFNLIEELRLPLYLQEKLLFINARKETKLIISINKIIIKHCAEILFTQIHIPLSKVIQ